MQFELVVVEKYKLQTYEIIDARPIRQGCFWWQPNG
jgi:hypothetical protein